MGSQAYLGSNYQFHSQMTEGLVPLLSSSIACPNGYLSQTGVSSILGSSRILSDSLSQIPCQNEQFVPGEINLNVWSNPTNSGTSIEDSSLITDANSSLSGGSYLPGTGSNSTNSHESNCLTSGSRTENRLSTQQQTSEMDQTEPHFGRRQTQQLYDPTSVFQLKIPEHQLSVPPMRNFKKPRLDIRQEDSMFPHSWQQQLLPGQNPMQPRSNDHEQASTLFQGQKHTTLLSVANPERVHMQAMSPQYLPRDIQQQLAAMTALKGGICARRLMYFMYHQRRRPPDNNIGYWRKFVEEYYSPCAKKRWCLSKYSNVGRHAHGVLSHAAMDAWTCDFCGSKLGKGFEATFEVLPRLKKTHFESGVVDELLYLDFPYERKLPSGCMMLCFGKAVQETVYKNFRVVHEGQLRVIFTQELKIISWEFCVQRHEELIPRRSVANQVNELVQDAARCQNNTDGFANVTNGVLSEDLLSNCNRLAAAGNQLARHLELPLVNELGFSKQFVRCLQISEVLNCMKDLISFSHGNSISPIESVKRFNAKLKMRHMEENTQGPVNWSELMAVNAGNNLFMPQTPNGREHRVSNSKNYYQKLLMDEPMISDSNFLKPEPQRSSASYMTSANASLGPSSSHQDPTYQHRILNDLLEMMRSEGAKGVRSKSSRGKQKFVYDPKVQGAQFGLGGTQTKAGGGAVVNGIGPACILGGMVEKGKGFGNFSYSFVKREPDLEEEEFHLSCS